MTKETENTKEKTRERTTDTQQEKQKPILKAQIAAFCVGLISDIFRNFLEDMEKQQGQGVNRTPPSFFRGLDELIRLVELQDVFLKYLPRDWDQDIEEKNLYAEFIEKDEVAFDLVKQLHRRRMHFQNTGKVMEVE